MSNDGDDEDDAAGKGYLVKTLPSTEKYCAHHGSTNQLRDWETEEAVLVTADVCQNLAQACGGNIEASRYDAHELEESVRSPVIATAYCS